MTVARVAGLLAGILLGALLVKLGMFAPTSDATRAPREPAADDDRESDRETAAAESSGRPAAAPPPANPSGELGTTPPAGLAIQTRTARDDFAAFDQVVTRHDEKARRLLRAGVQSAVVARTGRCGTARARSLGHTWMLNTTVAIDVAITADQARIDDLFFSPGAADVAGDETFQACARSDVIGAAFPCPGCRPGKLTVPFPITMRQFTAASEANDGGA